MKKLTDGEWAVLRALWSAPRLSLGEVTALVQAETGWQRNTVFTYLTRMEKKGLVAIERGSAQPYRAAVTREDCAAAERAELLRVYNGAAGELVAAFLRQSSISAEERDRLRQLLDEMEV
ncbi:MAG: BlaI/MecI/CopY family transcriptional regulator [Clostridiales bacterium]|nr:BlaI/MecI/CopY family transcriptional regulator [Clostridiales bacterium]